MHWERGAEVFEEWLIDHETACNSGNWMWVSCTAFYSQFYRCYSPIAFPKKTDINGDFVRHFVPELKAFDKKYIYEPWKAPIADQKRWGCLIRGDGTEMSNGSLKVYPKPMFDFATRKDSCIDAMKEAYHVNMHGDDSRVLDGSWKEIFGYQIEGLAKKRDERNGDEVEGQRPKKQVKAGPGKKDDEDNDGDEDRAGSATAMSATGTGHNTGKLAVRGGKGAKGQQARVDMFVTRRKDMNE